jgi:arginyl-tRNA synthetase
MDLTAIKEELAAKLRSAAREIFDIEPESITVEVPPKPELGDLAFPAAFELARLIKNQTGIKHNPREIAEKLKERISELKTIDRIQIAGAGYLNVFIDKAALLQNLSLPSVVKPLEAFENKKICVEHTSVNPNKAAHVGHLRNAVLGDTFQRILRALGARLEVQNYIDNTGVQVADVVVGFYYVEKLDLAGIKQLDHDLKSRGVNFDYYCWDLYSKVGQLYEKDETLRSRRSEVLHILESGEGEIARIAEFVSTRNVECILQTMERLGITYDLLARESDILHLNFWDKAFEKMKQLGVVRFETEGRHKGCWVMPFESHSGTDEHEADKILVRSNGTVTYTGKDIAYQMWKLGLMDLDFNYRLFRKYEDGHRVWETTTEAGEIEHPSFGKNDRVYNVVDSRQSYPQEVVKKGVAAIDPKKGLEASVHLSYEMVALSANAAEELGFLISDEDRKKPYIEMSGRKGLGVKADDLITLLEEKAAVEVSQRHPELTTDEKKEIASKIAVGALRYFLLKFTRNTLIVFDFAEALAFEGETGCFCQYSAVRANSIFKKLDPREQTKEWLFEKISAKEKVKAILEEESSTDIWNLLMFAMRFSETVATAALQSEPAIIAKYAFNLAKNFNSFYKNHKIIGEADDVKRALLILTAIYSCETLKQALLLLGIEVPEQM